MTISNSFWATTFKLEKLIIPLAKSFNKLNGGLQLYTRFKKNIATQPNYIFDIRSNYHK